MRSLRKPLVSLFVLFLALLTTATGYGQREVGSPPTQEYGARFFDQLQKIFGRFRDADLARVFKAAQPILCSELVTDKGEWREVAFFNENRKLGDWYRTSLQELKDDLGVFIFKGACGGRHAAAQLTTEFPVDESVRAYRDGRIRFSEIDVNVNAPVTVTFDSQTEAYSFELPYMFRGADDNADRIYSLHPRRRSDRYAPEVKNRWDCKRVAAEDVTYQFLICRTVLLPRNAVSSQNRNEAFGASAYSILSDGKEASSSVKLSFDPAADSPRPSTPAPQPAAQPAVKAAWQTVNAQTRLIDVGQAEFRLRFKAEVWQKRIDQPQFIVDGAFASTSVVPRNKAYCSWRVGSRSQVMQLIQTSADASVIHSLEFRKQTQSGVSAIFEMQSDTGSVLGVLDCLFVQSQSPGDITMGQWQSIVGSNLELEIPTQ